MKNFLDVSPKFTKRKRAKSGTANFITLKCCESNTVALSEEYDMITKNPDKASEQTILKWQRGFDLGYDQRLFTIASYHMGHYLIYDNKRVLAYTIIRL